MGRYRVTVPEAAKRLGVKEGAIRKRIERNTIDHEKSVEDGRVYVYVDIPPVEDMGYDGSYPPGYEALIKSQQEQIEFLRGELQRKDHLLAAALERIPAIEAPSDTPSDARESTVTASDEPSRGEVPEEQEEPKKQPWWKRWFGS